MDDSAPPGPALRAVAVTRVGRDAGMATRVVPEEQPVAFLYNGEPYAVMMASPADLEDFALGFSLAEGVVRRAGELEGLQVVPRPQGVELQIAIPERRARLLAARPRNLAGRSSCGLCGVASLHQALRPLPVLPDGPRVAAEAVMRAVRALADRQPLFAAAGAVHAAAWCDLEGRILLLREDVGRHNALDKAIGARARGGSAAAPGFALITSRLSVEMVQKAATAGIGLLAALSAPTALAVEQAEATGMTLVVSARADGLQIASHPERVTGGTEHG